MLIITVDSVDPHVAQQFAEAAKGIVPSSSVKLYAAIPIAKTPPAEPAPNPELLAKVVEAVRPHPSQDARREFLRDILLGGNSFIDNKGETDHGKRAASVGLSKALKKVFPSEPSPLDKLVQRKRTYFPDGHYKGIEYGSTPLSRQVYKLLKAEGAI